MHIRASASPPLRILLVIVSTFAATVGLTGRAAAQDLVSTITYPANGAVSADLTQPIQWTSVANVQAYYLYVGTTLGAKDVVNTGEIQATSYLASNLPVNQTLYARINAKVGGVWRYTDSTFSAGATQTLTATITYPANGAVNADMTHPIQWTSVLNAQSYYLYVGTTAGAKDLVNTGEIQTTSFLALNLPANQVVYARIYAKVAGIWRYTDSSFTAVATTPLTSTMTYPANGAVYADMTQPIQWTTVPNVQAYYLYVGSTPGAKDLVNTGEIQATSYLATSLPANQTLYARIYAKVGGVWRYTETTFTAGATLTALITYPANGAANANLTQPIQWTTVTDAQAYYLYVGTTQGAKDLVNTGEIHVTSYLVGSLPAGQVVYARLWTKVADVWRYRDSSFSVATVADVIATLTYPTNGAAGVDQALPATWNAIPNVQAYYLYVGTTLGAKDLIDSGETPATSLSIAGLPAGQTVYARLWTKVAGVWRWSDSTFSASVLAPAFIYPTDGQSSVDPGQPFQWTPPANAIAHELRVGTTPGGNDVFDSGQILTTSAVVPGLPTTGTLYARVLSEADGAWTHTDISFTLGPSASIATISVPGDGEAGFDTARPFEWLSAPMAHAYRLTIGTAPGANDLHDSGEIHMTQRFVPNLPIGQLFGRLATEIAGQWYTSDFTFSVGANTVSSALQIKSALTATDAVRAMALGDNRAFSGTLLAGETWPRFQSVCSDYAETLLRALVEINVQLPAKRLDVALNPNRYDTHTLVELFDTDSQRWLLLDPTFDLTVTRTSDGTWATADDVSAATRAEQWSDVSYQFLGSAGDAWARGYYLDYPLLFVDVYHDGAPAINGQGGPVLIYMEQMTLPISSTHQVYAVGCTGDTTATVRVDGHDVTLDCTGVDGLSPVFGASTIEATSGTSSSVVVYRPRRFVF